MRSTTHERISGTPSVIEYCNAAAPRVSITARVAIAISSVGKSSGAGSPPANEITSARCVVFNISRTVEAFMRDMRLAKRCIPRTVFMRSASTRLSRCALHGWTANRSAAQLAHITGGAEERKNRRADADEPHDRSHGPAHNRHDLCGRNDDEPEHERDERRRSERRNDKLA